MTGQATAETSRDAYFMHRATGELGEQQRQVMLWMHLNPGAYTRSEMAERMRMRLSSVCGRVNELIEMNYLEDGERRKCSVTGRSAYVVRIRVSKNPEQLYLLEAGA